mmetsp:Transcript_110641/g.298164  ORF Transcript_110641/g.298164 Transcript_110641/m.298164 type:complete len:363 (-) Transcript_110641:129-1217(-)
METEDHADQAPAGAAEVAAAEPSAAGVDGMMNQAAVEPAWVHEQTFASEECSVCFEMMGGSCPMRRLACGHGFHVPCIQRWLQQRASCPLCKADTPGVPTPKVFQVDLGHQEMAQIMTELEDIFMAVHSCAGPDRPVALNGLAYNLCVSLGYEDEDELEEAIGGTLADFLTALPHFKVHWPEPPDAGAACATGEVVSGEVAAAGEAQAAEVQVAEAPDPRATMKPEPTPEELQGPGSRIVFTVASREDLWRVVLQGPACNIEIPELEFVIRPRAKRRVDTIYNMIASAVFHLGDHVQKNTRANAITEDQTEKIVAAMDQLNQLLDIEQPFTFVLSDRTGISEFKPMEGAHVGPWVEGFAEED